MGRAMRWLKKVFGGKKKRDDEHQEDLSEASPAPAEIRRWSFARHPAGDVNMPPPAPAPSCRRQVAAVPSHRSQSRRAAAAVVIQSAYRGYLARKALRALRSLVKLQALARGYLVRKQTNTTLRRLQTLIRIQAASCGGRAGDSSHQSPHPCSAVRSSSPRRAHRRRSSISIDFTDSNYEQSARIIEMDTCQIRSFSSRITGRRASRAPADADDVPPPVLTSSPLRCKSGPRPSMALSSQSQELRHTAARTTPRFAASECVSPITPAASAGALDGLLRRMSSADGGPPRYMANTASSAARARISSSPRRRSEGGPGARKGGDGAPAGEVAALPSRSLSRIRSNKVSPRKDTGNPVSYSGELQAMDYYLEKLW